MGNVDWEGMLGGTFVKIEENEEYSLVVANWKPQTSFKDDNGELRAGLTMDVLEMNDEPCTPPKTWTVTSIRALIGLRPILENAEHEVKIFVKKTGTGKKTQYEVRKLD